MKLTSSQANTLRRVGTVVLRLIIACAAAAALLCLALNMVLSMIFNGPSVTARNELTLTLLASESTQDIPSRFLDQQIIDGICRTADTLPADSSDPTLITVGSGQSAQLNVILLRSSASVTLRPAANAFVPAGAGSYYCGMTSEGILVVSTAADFNASTPCEAILIMNGQVNEGLYNQASGYSARTAIGQTADGTVILVTASGNTNDCTGATMQELINIMTEYGAVNACCLRSGSASEG